MPPFDPTKTERSKRARRDRATTDLSAQPPQGSFGLLGPRVDPPRTAGLLGPSIPAGGNATAGRPFSNAPSPTGMASKIEAEAGSLIGPQRDQPPEDLDEAFEQGGAQPILDPTTNLGAAVWYFTPGNHDIDVPFNRVDVGMQARDFRNRNNPFKDAEPFMDTVNKLRGQSGTFPYSGRYKADIGGAFGQMTYNLKGNIKTSVEGWQFSGNITAPKDDYDFNEQPIGQRPLLEEIAVRLEKMVPGGRVFTFVFQGGRQVSDQGSWR